VKCREQQYNTRNPLRRSKYYRDWLLGHRNILGTKETADAVGQGVDKSCRERGGGLPKVRQDTIIGHNITCMNKQKRKQGRNIYTF